MPKQNRTSANVSVTKATSNGNSTPTAEMPVQGTIMGNGATTSLVQDPEQQSRWRVSPQQLELLAQSMEEAPKLALSLAKSREERDRAQQKWDRIAFMLNKAAGADKNGRGWLRYWTDLKFKVRRKHAYVTRERAGRSAVQLTPFERRLLRILTDGDGNLLFNNVPGQRESVAEDDHEPMHTEEVNVSSSPEPIASDSADIIDPHNEQAVMNSAQDPISIDERKISQLTVEALQFDLQRQKELHELEKSHLIEKHKIEIEILNLKRKKLLREFNNVQYPC